MSLQNIQDLLETHLVNISNFFTANSPKLAKFLDNADTLAGHMENMVKHIQDLTSHAETSLDHLEDLRKKTSRLESYAIIAIIGIIVLVFVGIFILVVTQRRKVFHRLFGHSKNKK